MDYMESTILWGTWNLIFYAIYYWGFLKRFVFEKQTFFMLLSILLYAIGYSFYTKYIVNWVTSELPFVSQHIRDISKRNMEQLRPVSNIIPFVSTRLFIVVGFTYLIRSMQQDDQMKDMKTQQLFSEMTYLRAQLQPHFFFNTLNNIYALALKQSAQTAPIVAKLSQMMRYIIYESDQTAVPLTKEIEFLKHYIEVEKIRHTAHIDIQFDLQVHRSDYQMAPLLLLPLVENAFKHGLHEETAIGYVHVVICTTETELILEVKNSKPKEKLPGGETGLGLKNLKKRLALLYPSRHQYEVNEGENHYYAQLTLELT